ncbi:hypothetical protein D3C76_1502580 [compost metagenome]
MEINNGRTFAGAMDCNDGTIDLIILAIPARKIDTTIPGGKHAHKYLLFMIVILG